MKKIMFNDSYGLTQAVIEGRKTMTRRIIPSIEVDWNRRGKVQLSILGFEDGVLLMDTRPILGSAEKYAAPRKYQPKYELDEVIAIAQPYEDISDSPGAMQRFMINPFGSPREKAGWTNKMFVCPGLMKHYIRITGIKVERLQDISDEDCIKEGIKCYPSDVMPYLYAFDNNHCHGYSSPKEAFAALIDKVNGKGTWDRNPYVFAYTFELLKGGDK